MKKLIPARELIWHKQPIDDEIFAGISRINKDLVVYPKSKKSKSSEMSLPEIGRQYVIFASNADHRALLDQGLVSIIWFPKPLDSNSWICLADENPVWEVDGKDLPADTEILDGTKIIVCSVNRDEKMEDKYLFSIMVEKVFDLNSLVARPLDEEEKELSELLCVSVKSPIQKIETRNLLVTFSGELGFFKFTFFKKMEDGFRLVISGVIQETKEFYYLENLHYNKLDFPKLMDMQARNP